MAMPLCAQTTAFTRRSLAAGLLGLVVPAAPAPVAARTRAVLPAIEAHRSANLLLSQAVADHARAERADDPAQVMLLRLADAASDAETAALDALRACVPADAAELRALILYYADLAAEMDPRMFGSWLLSGLATAARQAAA